MKIISQVVKALFMIAGLVAVQPALQAHTDEYLDQHGAVHGGMMRMSGPYHLELVVESGRAVVWVMDHANQPRPTAGAQGQLILFQDGERVVLDLEPDGDSRMLAEDSRISATDSPRAVLTLSMRGQAPLQVRYAELTKAKAKTESDHEHDHGHADHAH
ncbi:hypothetical protein TspCOW1_21970 [Thiohalobacter sp. COW1]|uniref:hypothetical protein n=1 Tax=Thiohalobacter sp. COW1 TaxID=2795687 RepID=UPI00191664B6|nr:hypothetical protein [Thiohalobacter sp. COW1]BCO32094.1 hypothetical protein TspCOW1_21970 [Thiohalobacter sp. COW1]